MNAAWKEFLQTIRCDPLEQHEFTWHRIAKRADDKQENEEVAAEAAEEQNEQTEKEEEQDDIKRSYSYAILDVMTTSAQQYDDILYVPVAKRLDSIPQSISDHYPIALEWRLRKQTKRHNSKLSGQEIQSQEKNDQETTP